MAELKILTDSGVQKLAPAAVLGQTFTIEQLLQMLGVPIQALTDRLNAIVQSYPDLNVPVGTLLEVIGGYLTTERINTLKLQVAAEWLALIQQGKNEIEHSPIDLV